MLEALSATVLDRTKRLAASRLTLPYTWLDRQERTIRHNGRNKSKTIKRSRRLNRCNNEPTEITIRTRISNNNIWDGINNQSRKNTVKTNNILNYIQDNWAKFLISMFSFTCYIERLKVYWKAAPTSAILKWYKERPRINRMLSEKVGKCGWGRRYMIRNK